MNLPVPGTIVAGLREAGLLAPGREPQFTPLTGGVASDIWQVGDGEVAFVVKCALPKLRVAADWQVPVSRNRCEVAWLRMAASILPGAVPVVLAHDPDRGFFAMQYLDRTTHPVWKHELREGRADPSLASAVGHALGAIHAGTAGKAGIAPLVNDDTLFRAIRLEPYLEYTAARHPAAAEAIHALVADVLANRKTLVHGDVSPKNILVGPDGPVFLDAECAWYGDPAFDLAFCLNHLLLKCLWVPDSTGSFLDCYSALAESYLATVDWENPAALERRAARLLPALLLARVDGRSPVEYLTEDRQKSMVRAFAVQLLERPAKRLDSVKSQWAEALQALRSNR